MLDYLIRKATLSDALNIATIHVNTWKCTYKRQIPDNYLDNLSIVERKKGWEKILSKPEKNEYAFVAETSGKVVGWSTGGVSRDSDSTKDIGELYGIYIDSKYINKGAGTTLMEHMLTVLRKDGYKQATLWVLDTNHKTRNFYEKKGWHIERLTKVEPRDSFSLHEIRYIINL